MPNTWTADRILDLVRGYQPASILVAAADLELFDVMAGEHLTADAVARRLKCDRRGVTILLDVLVALGFLAKRRDRYCVPPGVAKALTRHGADSVLAMVQHQGNCLRRWDQLAQAVKTGKPAQCEPSIRGKRGDTKSFIGAMHDINARVAAPLVRDIQPLPFRRVLDVGGGSGTWTIALLRANPAAKATLFDLPRVIPLARKRLAQAGLLSRVSLVAGDFSQDPLPQGCDLTWVSAIVHQNSRGQNRELFRNIHRALDNGGRIAIRDIVMELSRTAPIAGVLFAVNMLVATAGGGTFTFEELQADLKVAGFVGARLVRRDEGMHSVIVARKRP